MFAGIANAGAISHKHAHHLLVVVQLLLKSAIPDASLYMGQYNQLYQSMYRSKRVICKTSVRAIAKIEAPSVPLGSAQMQKMFNRKAPNSNYEGRNGQK